MLAHMNQKHDPRVGKYRGSLEDLNNIGVDAIMKAVENSDIVAIDELDLWNCILKGFRKRLRRLLKVESL